MSAPGPMKAWLVEHESGPAFLTIDEGFVSDIKNGMYTVTGGRISPGGRADTDAVITPMTAVPCPEGMQVGDRVRVDYNGEKTEVVGAPGPTGLIPHRAYKTSHAWRSPNDLTPIPDEPERTYTEDEVREAVLDVLSGYRVPVDEADEILARLREQGGER